MLSVGGDGDGDGDGDGLHETSFVLGAVLIGAPLLLCVVLVGSLLALRMRRVERRALSVWRTNPTQIVHVGGAPGYARQGSSAADLGGAVDMAAIELQQPSCAAGGGDLPFSTTGAVLAAVVDAAPLPAPRTPTAAGKRRGWSSTRAVGGGGSAATPPMMATPDSNAPLVWQPASASPLSSGGGGDDDTPSAALERARRSSGSGRRSSRPLEWSGGDGALHSSNSFAASPRDGSPQQPSNGSRNGSPRPSKAVHEVHL